IDEADGDVDTAAKQAAVTTLIEAWMEPDAEGVKTKANRIADSKLAEAAYKVVEANTANRLYNALVAFADLAEDTEYEIDAKDLKEENKQFYFAAYRVDGKLILPVET